VSCVGRVRCGLGDGWPGSDAEGAVSGAETARVQSTDPGRLASRRSPLKRRPPNTRPPPVNCRLRRRSCYLHIPLRLKPRSLNWTRRKAKPDRSPSGYPSNRLLIIVNLLLNWLASVCWIRHFVLPAPCIAIALLVVCRRRRPSECRVNSKVSIGSRFWPQNWLPRQRPFRNREKNNFRSFIYG